MLNHFSSRVLGKSPERTPTLGFEILIFTIHLRPSRAASNPFYLWQIWIPVSSPTTFDIPSSTWNNPQARMILPLPARGHPVAEITVNNENQVVEFFAPSQRKAPRDSGSSHHRRQKAQISITHFD